MERACSVRVYYGGAWHGHQCRRAAKVEREGVWYCRQHDPVAVAEKRAIRGAKWEASWAAQQAARAEADRQKGLAKAAINAIKAIAAGHNDPRTLAQETLAEHGEHP